MFDNLVAAHGPSPRGRARTIVITTSVIVHAAAVAALAIWAMWRVDKLEVDAPGTYYSAMTLPRDSGGGGRPKVVLEARVEEKVVKVKPVVLVQPEKEVPKERIVTEAEVDGALAPGTDGTAPGNGTGGDGKGAGKPDGPPCEGTRCLGGGTGGGDDDDEKTCAKGETLIDGKCVKEKKVEVEVISPDVAKGLRKSGNDQIPAPTSVRTQMMRAGKTKAVGTLKLCLDGRGRVERVQVLKSTGYDEYDELLQKEMRAWRYEPYKVDGEGVPACTVVTIVYVMK